MIDWNALAQGGPLPPDGAEVTIEGEVFPTGENTPYGYLLMVAEPGCCAGCRPEPDTTVEVLLDGPAPVGTGQIRVIGSWHRLPPDDPAGWRWQLRKARIVGQTRRPFWLGRRGLMAAVPLVCTAPLAACAQVDAPSPAARALVAASAAMDMHSHAGRVILSRNQQRPFEPLAAPMREGGMSLVSLAVVADTPTTMVTPDRRIEAYRSPPEGELWAHGLEAFARLERLVAEENLTVVTDVAGLNRAGQGPAIVVASEGADFLEGRIERLEQVFRDHRLRHLQLVHYRVNELGDIQTAAPVHGGLTGFGEKVVRACNRLGIVVDVAHATMPVAQKAAEVTSRPIVLSHTALSQRMGLRSRLISPEHARLVAGTGGVIGIWPLVGPAPTIRLYAQSMMRMVDVVGIDHVGIGSDMRGLLGPGAFEDYRQTPALADALLGLGLDAAGVGKLMGGNYARVLAAVLPA